MGWDDVLDALLKHDLDVQLEDRIKDRMDKDSLDKLRTYGPEMLEETPMKTPMDEILTDALAIYRPASSTPKIEYHINKIAQMADLCLCHIINSLKIKYITSI